MAYKCKRCRYCEKIEYGVRDSREIKGGVEREEDRHRKMWKETHTH